MNIHPNIEKAAQARGQRIDRFLRTASNDLMQRVLAYSPPIIDTPTSVPPKKEAAPFIDGMPPPYPSSDDTTSGAAPALPAGFGFHIDMNNATGTASQFTSVTDSINSWVCDQLSPTIGSGGWKWGLTGSTGAKYGVSTGLPGFGLSFCGTTTKTQFQNAGGYTYAYDWTATCRVFVAGGDASNYGMVGLMNRNISNATPVWLVSSGTYNAIGTQTRSAGPAANSTAGILTSGTWVTLILKYNGTAGGSAKPWSRYLNGSNTAHATGSHSATSEAGSPGFMFRLQNGSASVLPRFAAGGFFNGLMSDQQMLDTHNYYASKWNSTTAP